MTKLQLSIFMLLIFFSSSAMPATQTVDWQIQTMRNNAEPVLLNVKTTASFKCDSPLTKRFSGTIDIYSVDYRGYEACNATQGKMLGSLKCGQPHNNKTKPLEIVKMNEAETYYFIGFAREKAKPDKPVLLSGTCKSHKSKLMIHFCDPVLTPNGESCTMESCPLSLGVEDGRITDKQLTANSELDEKHSAKHGRLSSKKDHIGAWCAAPTFDLGTQYIQVDLQKIHAVSAVSTQGAVTEKSWVSGYLVHYSLDGTDWIVVSDEESEIKIFMGNKDEWTVVRHWLKPHIDARFVRFVPSSWVGQRCMRVELRGCKKEFVPIETLKAKLTKDPRPCESKFCANISYSKCFMYSGKPQCKCVQSCTLEIAEVCGSDGKTYQNECELKQAACLNNKHVDIVKRDRCIDEAEKKCPSPWTGPSVGEVCNRAGDECKTDDECSDDRNCCHDGCRKVCVAHNQGQAENKCPSPWTGPSLGEVCNRAGNECETDDECSDDRKCCHDGCRKVCVEHKQDEAEKKCPSPSVGEVCNRAGDECKTDDECSDDGNCCHDGCRKVCVAQKKASAEKRCPSPWTGPSVGEVCNRAGDECKTDDVCSDDRNCCHDGCRKVCVARNQGQAENKCPSPWTGPSLGEVCNRAGNECETDDECSDDRKCCHDGCRKVCVEHKQDEAEKKCPSPWTGPGVGEVCNRAGDECKTDDECSDDRNCCHDGCRKVCEAQKKASAEKRCPSPWTGPGVGEVCNRAGDECKTDDECSDDRKCCHDGCRKVCTSHAQERFSASGSSELCGGVSCPPYAQCNHTDNGEKCVCPSCSHDGKKVCGSDGKTYKDSCKLKKHSCVKNQHINVVSEGGCEERFSAIGSIDLCGGVSCPPYAQCNHTDNGEKCVCPSCSHDGKKVCGSDGKTYKDSCKLKKHSCEKNQHINVVSQDGCAALPNVAVSGPESMESKEKKSSGSFKTFYICIIFVAVLGVVIALAMCIFQPHKSRQIGGRRHQVSNGHKETAFKRLHNKYHAEDVEREDK